MITRARRMRVQFRATPEGRSERSGARGVDKQVGNQETRNQLRNEEHHHHGVNPRVRSRMPKKDLRQLHDVGSAIDPRCIRHRWT
jgi:hypothetical protein